MDLLDEIELDYGLDNRDIYNNHLSMLENDEITPAEEGFMNGYNHALEV